jgi:hypothetical protein
MTVKSWAVEQMQQGFRIQIENRKMHPKGVGRPNKEDSAEKLVFSGYAMAKNAHAALVEEKRNRDIGLAFSATESVRGVDSPVQTEHSQSEGRSQHLANDGIAS